MTALPHAATDRPTDAHSRLEPAAGDAAGPPVAASRPAGGALRGRPLALIALWILVLGALAAVAPAVQNGLGVPWDVLILVMLAPAIATLIVRLAVPRWRAADWPAVPWGQVAAPAALALLYSAVVVGAMWWIGGEPPQLPAAVSGVPLALFVLLQAAGALGEEIGWRGEMQRAGEQLMPAPIATIAMGALFGLTHLGYWGLGPAFMIAFATSSVLMVLAMRLIWRGSTRQRMVPATLIHLGTNLALFAIPLDVAQTPLWLMPVPAALGLVAVAPFGLAMRSQRAASADRA